MKVETRKTSQLIPYEKNAKKHPKKQIAQVAESIKQFGFRQPIVIDSKNVVVIGHARLEAAKLLGLAEVPVHLADNLTDVQIKALRLADNKLNESKWDLDLAIEELKEIDAAGLGMEITGFERDLLHDLSDEDQVPPLPEVAESKLGDIYELGNNRVMCGSATSKDDVTKLMNGKLADMIFTDPPYNVNYSGRGKNTSNTIKNDNQDEQSFRKFLTEAFHRYVESSKNEAGMYCCYASSTHREFEDSLNEAAYEVKNQIIWVKLVASMGWGDYRWKHEPILYCHKRSAKINFYGDRSQYTVWEDEPTDEQILKRAKAMLTKEESGGSTVWRLNRDRAYDHPTQKPLKLCEIAIKNSSQRGGLVIDFFGGSGSTLIAAEELGRHCYAMELDPRYVDVIVKRWENWTGQKAKKLTPST